MTAAVGMVFFHLAAYTVLDILWRFPEMHRVQLILSHVTWVSPSNAAQTRLSTL